MATIYDVAHFCSWNGYAEDMKGYLGIDRASMTNQEFHFPFGANVTYGNDKKTRIQRICEEMTPTYDPNNYYAYEMAKGYNAVERVKQLIEYGAKPDIKDAKGWSALMECSCNGWSGHKDIAEILIKAGADVNQLYQGLYSPLYIAARNKNMHMVKVLIDMRADVNLRGSNSDGVAKASPLEGACEGGSIEIIKYLVSKGAQLNNGVYKMAISGGHIGILKYLFTLCPAPADAIWFAMHNEHNQHKENNQHKDNKYTGSIIYTLAKYGGDVNYIYDERTLLETAVLMNYNCVHELLRAGANPNVTAMPNEMLPISMAIMDGNIKKVKVLCEYSANVDLLHRFGASFITPVHMAIIYTNAHPTKKEYMECLKELVKKSKLSVQDSDGDTPLEAAVSRGNNDAIIVIKRELLARKFKK